MAETLTAPLTPGPHGARWLAEEMLRGDMAEVRKDVLPDVPPLLRERSAFGLKIKGWQVAARLAEIGDPPAQIHNPDRTKAERRESRACSAHMMAYVGYAALATAHSGHQEDMTSFLGAVRATLVTGARPVAGETLSPGREAILDYGLTLHHRLGFDVVPKGDESSWALMIDELFDYLNQQVLSQMQESLPGQRDPQRLLNLAMKAGGACAQMAALVAAKPANIKEFEPILQAANAFGGIGFLEEQITKMKIGRMETYASARVRQERGVEGLSLKGVRRGMRAAHAMRKEVEARLVHEGMSVLPEGRPRDIYGSQLWFAKYVYKILQRAPRRLGRDRRIAKQLG